MYTLLIITLYWWVSYHATKGAFKRDIFLLKASPNEVSRKERWGMFISAPVKAPIAVYRLLEYSLCEDRVAEDYAENQFNVLSERQKKSKVNKV